MAEAKENELSSKMEMLAVYEKLFDDLMKLDDLPASAKKLLGKVLYIRFPEPAKDRDKALREPTEEEP